MLGVLIGFALSADNSKPRVAFLNEIPASDTEQFAIGSGDESIDQGIARDRLCSRVECVDVSSREEAEQKVEDGDVIAALILPAGPARQARVAGQPQPRSSRRSRCWSTRTTR